MLSVRKLTLGYGGAPLLDEISFELKEGDRACLVGRNGTGKTSLLRMLVGLEAPDGGEIQLAKGKRLAYLPQAVPEGLSGEVAAYVRAGLAEQALADWEEETRLERTLEEMELPGTADLATLSAGMKRRALLGRSIVAEPDLLILDEPTNHLDLPAIRWMEDFLRNSFRGTLLFVTHDRAFLQAIATRILDLDRGQLISWDCDYQRYLERKEAWLEAEAHQQAEFDKKLAEEERWIRRGIQARRTRNEGRVRALKAMRREHQARRAKTGTASLQIDAAERSGAKVIEAEGLSFGYDGAPVVENFSTLIERGDKVGLIGPNGAGKTTLLRLLLGELEPAKGTVTHGTKLEVAYYDQLRNQLDPARTVVDTIADGSETVMVNGRAKHVMSYLGDFLFPPDRARSTVGMLSGGERNRLLLARLFTRPANLLVLDEPTNDLDLETVELLEEQLAAFNGTVLLVSHDRAFLDAVVTELLVLRPGGKVESFVGGYSDWLEKHPTSSAAAASSASGSPSPAAPARSKPAGAKVQRPPRRERFLNRERWELDALPGEIEALEAEQARIATALADPKLYQESPEKITALQARHTEIEASLRTRYERWEALEERRSALEEG
ncbi:MAG: ATP-binding cassette domain-containing protein [Opitutales bacterium]